MIMWEWMNQKSFFFYGEAKFPIFSIFLISACLLSIWGKSAQMFFHPWLTSAMEGPTPVSSLLHSSTMVVAGVYFFFKIFYFVEMENFFLQKILLFSSSFTGILVSFSAFYFKDSKKIVALSTTSQLSFMIFLMAIGQKDLAFFHLLLHGFFKALLFLWSGVIIHENFNSQDSRESKLSKKKIFLLSLGVFPNLGILGTPFIAAFWSKHSILSSFYQNSFSFWALSILLFSLSLTSGYSIRFFFSSFLSKSQNSPKKITSLKESNYLLPFFFLVFSSISLGWVGFSFFISPFSISLPFFFFKSHFFFFLFSVLGFFLFFNFEKNSFFWFYYMFSSFLQKALFYFLSSKKSSMESVLEKFATLFFFKNFLLSKTEKSLSFDMSSNLQKNIFFFLFFLLLFFFFFLIF